MKTLLFRYWIKTTEFGNQFGYGIGVTAYSQEDAQFILSQKINKKLKIESFTVINSLEDLEQNHVLSNMEEFIHRGIWYPKGYK